MVRRSGCLAAISLAALAAVSPQLFADQQDARRSLWALSAERGAWGEDRLETARSVSPSGVFNPDIGWLKASDLKPGSGLQLDLAQSWALHADWDRHRPKAAQVRETIDTFLLGVQYRFR